MARIDRGKSGLMTLELPMCRRYALWMLLPGLALCLALAGCDKRPLGETFHNPDPKVRGQTLDTNRDGGGDGGGY